MPASVVFFLWWTPVTGDTNIPALNDLLIPFGVAFGDKILNGAFSIDGEHGRYAAGTDTVRFSAGGYVHAFHFFHAIIHFILWCQLHLLGPFSLFPYPPHTYNSNPPYSHLHLSIFMSIHLITSYHLPNLRAPTSNFIFHHTHLSIL